MSRALAALALLASPLALHAQVQSFGHRWVELEPIPVPLAYEAISAPSIEVDFAVGDLDSDGFEDLVVVRKEPFSKPGMRTNVLMMNVGGALLDRTELYAAASDVPGDQGFLTPTNDRDVELADVDLDGRLDVITATTLGDGLAKSISHPRVYRNLGASGGSWQGIFYEEARIPQLFTEAGLAVAPHANGVAAGDVDADGSPDLYFVDHDTGLTGFTEPPHLDLEDRLLINDGAGYFVDETALRMPAVATLSGFGLDGFIGDFNLDGTNDVMRGSTNNLTDPITEVSVTYNRPDQIGHFLIHQDVYQQAPYSVAAADLNEDDRLDLVVGDDFQDRYLLNTGNDALGRVIWSPPLLFDFLAGADDGFVGEIRVADLDADGWQDVLIADVDIDTSGSHRRLHVYHNLGGAPGDAVKLREERQSGAAGGWLGAAGLQEAQIKGTYDVAAIDLDRDGYPDLVLGRVTGFSIWRNRTGDQVCQQDLGFAGPGLARLSLCGDTLVPGGSADLVVAHARASAPGVLAFGLSEIGFAYGGGTLVPLPIGLASFTTDHAGKWVLPNVAGTAAPSAVTLQAVVIDPSQPHGIAITNALRAQFGS